MKRHATDMVSLVFGVLFVFVAAWWAVDRYVDVNIDLPNVGWIAAAALIVLGVIGVVASLRGDRTPVPSSAPPADEASDPWLMAPVPPAPVLSVPPAPLAPLEPLPPAEPFAPLPPFEPHTPEPPGSTERISGAASFEPSTAEQPTFEEPPTATPGDSTEEPTPPAKPDH